MTTSRSGRRRRRAAAAAIGIATLLGSAACGSGTRTPGVVVAAPVTAGVSVAGWHGTVPAVPRRRPSFVLTDTSGHRFDLAKDTHGRATLLYFGYTHCPDICPLTMANIAAAMRSLPLPVRSRTSVVFVTTDPRRDTGPAVRAWLDEFDASFVGLTGTEQQIETAERAVGIPGAVTEQVGAEYTVSHAAQVVGYGVDDLEHVVYFTNARPADFRADLPKLAAV